MLNRLGIPCYDVRFTALKTALMPTKPGFSQWKSNQIMANGHCFTVPSEIAECWHIIAACEVCIIWREQIGACQIQSPSQSRRLIELRWFKDIKLDCFMIHRATLSPCMQGPLYGGAP